MTSHLQRQLALTVLHYGKAQPEPMHYGRGAFSAVKASRSFGYFFAKTEDISIEKFTNVVTSYKK